MFFFYLKLPKIDLNLTIKQIDKFFFLFFLSLPYKNYNPIHLNFHHFFFLESVVAAKEKEKIKISHEKKTWKERKKEEIECGKKEEKWRHPSNFRSTFPIQITIHPLYPRYRLIFFFFASSFSFRLKWYIFFDFFSCLILIFLFFVLWFCFLRFFFFFVYIWFDWIVGGCTDTHHFIRYFHDSR